MKKKQMRYSQNRSKDSLGSILTGEQHSLESMMRGNKIIRVVQKVEERKLQLGFRKISVASLTGTRPFIALSAAENQYQMSIGAKKADNPFLNTKEV